MGAGTRLDDSPSPRQRLELTAQWEAGAEGAEGELLSVVAEARDVDLRFNTAPWRGREVEIYIGFPQSIPGLTASTSMRIEWRTRGRFVSGSAIPGQRVLVYRGPITDAVSGDVFDFLYRIDGRHFERSLQVRPVFEIEPRP
jgi:hypothetical protein